VLECRKCDYVTCPNCLYTRQYHAQRAIDAAADPVAAALDRPSRVQVIVPDVVGIVLQYACETAAEAYRYGNVCGAWRKGLLNDKELWRGLFVRRWPRLRVPRRVTSSLYLARARALRHLASGGPRAGAVMESALTPIENCDRPLACPLYKEALRELAREDGQRVFNCDVCKRKVYQAKTQEELDRRAAAGDCVAFSSTPRSIIVEKGTTFYFVGIQDDDGRGAWRLLLHTLLQLQYDGWAIDNRGLRGAVEAFKATSDGDTGGAHATLRVVVATTAGVQFLGTQCVVVPTGVVTKQAICGGSNCHETQSSPTAVARIITEHFREQAMMAELLSYREEAIV
jgi:hypothetical protein